MSPIAWVATILILAPTSSTATTPAVVLPANAVLLGEPTASGLTRQCSRSTPDFEATWTPSVAEILQLESDLGLLDASPQWPKRLKPSELLVRSRRQYVGLVNRGRRYIYLNAFPSSQGDKAEWHWLSRPYVMCDGGSAYWGLLYEPAKREFTDVSFNGHG